MRKLFIVIVILAIVFIGMLVYRNITNAKNNDNNISIEEINNIEKYISKIYLWKEVTKEALPEFENINDADELWVWEVVKKGLEETDLTYDQIQIKKEDVFGESLKKDFPKERK